MLERINEIRMALNCASAKINDPWIKHANRHLDLLEAEANIIIPFMRDFARGMYPHEHDWVEGCATKVMERIGEPLEYEHESQSSTPTARNEK